MQISSHIENFLKDLGFGANHLGHKIYIVGGSIRNELFKDFHDPSLTKKQDIDLVINTNAIEFIDKYQRFYEDNHDDHITFDILEKFDQFGTVKINHPEDKDCQIEIASTRTEVYKEPAAFPTVTIIDSIEKDLQRRDFTINALLKSLNRYNYGEIIDYIGGIDDMQKKLIRVFHDDSFIDDPTRIYRAVRFMLEYDFEIEEHTLALIEKALNDERFPEWFKKRKNRFEIEKENITKLGKDKQAIEFLKNLNHNFS
jgi:tRNA nucleotidyltransferase (CCA-adding enzyme)